jgi:hypothetical protein
MDGRVEVRSPTILGADQQLPADQRCLQRLEGMQRLRELTGRGDRYPAAETFRQVCNYRRTSSTPAQTMPTSFVGAYRPPVSIFGMHPSLPSP